MGKKKGSRKKKATSASPSEPAPMSKAKQRKAALAAETTQKNACAGTCKAATAAGAGGALLTPFAPFQKFSRNSLELRLAIGGAAGAPRAEQEWALGLTRQNMKGFYDAAAEQQRAFWPEEPQMAKTAAEQWLWSDGQKKAELLDEAALTLVAREPSEAEAAETEGYVVVSSPATSPVKAPAEEEGGEAAQGDGESLAGGAAVLVEGGSSSKAAAAPGAPKAFVNFRFEPESMSKYVAGAGDVATCYIYELQTEESLRRKGVGKFLMQTLELVARKNGAEAMMLTCLNKNAAAMSFYTKGLGYKIAPNSPSLWEDETSPYEILWKPFSAELKAL